MTDYLTEYTTGLTHGVTNLEIKVKGKPPRIVKHHWTQPSMGFEIFAHGRVVRDGVGFVTEEYRDQAAAIALRALRGEKPKTLGIDMAGFKLGLKVWKALDKAA